MGAPLIGDRVEVARRYVRSIELERDLSDASALDGYVITPTVLDTLRRILRGLADGSTHRAFRITGPYGAGKSAFMLLLARLFLERRGQTGLATTLLGSHGAGPAAELDRTRWYEPLVVLGRRESLAELLLSAVERKFAVPRGRARRSAVAERAERLRAERSEGRFDDDAVLDLLKDYARSIDKARDGRGGLLILVDELGRCLEHATLKRGSVDPSLFQRLGEMAAGSGDAPVAVVGVLHQRFAEYASSLGERAQEEWTRSAERFEDLPFQESVEQTAFLLAAALKSAPHDPTVTRTGRELYAEAARRGLFPGRGVDAEELGSRLYPLHPASVVALSAVARRLGQNERSAFGFLQGHEPWGFRDFLASVPYGADHWYRLPDLLDHLLARGTAGPRDGAPARRWGLLTDALTGHPDLPPAEMRVLKCVGLLSLMEPLPGLAPDPDVVAFCLRGSDDAAAVSAALAALVERRMLYRRPHRGDYSLWASSSVDLEGWLDKARTQVPPPLRLDAAFGTLPPPRPVVAHKHYHETGTLRAFGVRLEDVAATQPPTAPGIDGWITVVLLYPGEDRVSAMRRLSAPGTAVPSLFCLREVPPSLLATAHELQVWRWVDANCPDLAMDDLARREVRERVRSTGERLAGALAPFARPATGEEAETTWLYDGAVVELRDRAALHRLLSRICDETYRSAPVVHNELVNRSKLSSAAAMARMKLMERMVTHGAEPGLGIEGTPPEKAIYLSVLRASGLHREETAGSWHFGMPDQAHPGRWHHAWKGIEAILSRGGAVAVDEILRTLQGAPFGIRPGVSLVLLTAFILARRHDAAFLERNTFVPEINGANLMRLARNPRNFGLRLIADASGPQAVLPALVSGMSIWKLGSAPAPRATAVTEALFAWYLGLPAFSRETRSISSLAQSVRIALDKATDPVELLFERLPTACGLASAGGDAFDPSQYAALLDECLQELQSAPVRLRAGAQAALLDAFGARDIATLRRQVVADYGPVEQALTEPRMRTFVVRTLDRTLVDQAWLDSVASLLTSRRLDAWRDDTADKFGFEAKALALRLNRWLAAARAQATTKVPVLSVHVVDPSGRETATVVRPVGESVDDVLVGRLRAMLAERRDAVFLLGRLLAEEVAKASEEVADDVR